MESHNSQGLRKNKKAMAPAVSTVILTAAVITLVLVAVNYANTFLDVRLAENEFSANRQFMLTAGLQIDDIAWTIGRTQTVRYSSSYGSIGFQEAALSYTFEIESGGVWRVVATNVTGMVMFKMPVDKYSVGNNYFDRIMPSSNGSFLQQGSTAPVSHVFCIEKLPMNDGAYTRVVVVPSIRMLDATITGPGGSSTKYYKFYLPILVPASSNPHLSQSITMTGNDIMKLTMSDVDQVRISVTYPNAASGLDAGFFNFESTTISVPGIAADSVVEFYTGQVVVTLGKF
jgi:hypothetical protein